jgi:hypothetical protein
MGVSLTGAALVLAAVGGSVLLAFTQCAVADLVVRIAAWLCGSSVRVRLEKREEWLGLMRDLKPSERPVHAASLLWAGAAAFPRSVMSCCRLRWKRTDVLAFLIDESQQPSTRRRLRLFLRPRSVKLLTALVDNALSDTDAGDLLEWSMAFGHGLLSDIGYRVN